MIHIIDESQYCVKCESNHTPGERCLPFSTPKTRMSWISRARMFCTFFTIGHSGSWFETSSLIYFRNRGVVRIGKLWAYWHGMGPFVKGESKYEIKSGTSCQSVGIGWGNYAKGRKLQYTRMHPKFVKMVNQIILEELGVCQESKWKRIQ